MKTTENLVSNSWRLFPHTYAIRQSKGRWKPYPHLLHISRIVGRGIINGGGRFIISMPPRHGKSQLLSNWIPTWFLDNFWWKRVILTSYAANYASRWGRRVRNNLETLENTCVLVDQASRAANRFDVARDLNQLERGGMITAGAGGPITGEGADLLIVDDPIKGWREAQSATLRENQKDWWKSVARTRVEPGGSIIVLMTRWHEDDLAGYLASSNDADNEFSDKWTVINMPAIAEENDILGRKEGAALCPERYDRNSLLKIKADLEGEMVWASMYQGRPYILEGNILKRSWWKFYDEAPMDGQIFQVWDTAQKPGLSNDYSVCATWKVTKTGYYLLDLWRNKVEAPDLERACENQYNKFSPIAVIIEDKSSGSSLIQNMRRRTRMPIIGFIPNVDKVARATAASPTIESGNCYLPKSAVWLEDFLLEHEQFPNAAHDDMVDATSMAIQHFQRIKGLQPSMRSL